MNGGLSLGSNIATLILSGGLVTALGYIFLIPVQRRKIKADTAKVGLDGESVAVRAAADLLSTSLPWVEELRKAILEERSRNDVLYTQNQTLDDKLDAANQKLGAARSRCNVLEQLLSEHGLKEFIPPVPTTYLV